jgi:hypothetical protein
MDNYHAGTTGNGIVPVNQIVVCLYIPRSPVTSGVNLSVSDTSHPIVKCRLHYSQIVVNPQKSLNYVQRNRNKNVVYITFVTNTYNNIGVGSSRLEVVLPTPILLTSSDFGVSKGVIHQGYWENNKWYFVNVERGNPADKLQPRNINVNFQNNSNVPMDLMVFCFILMN